MIFRGTIVVCALTPYFWAGGSVMAQAQQAAVSSPAENKELIAAALKLTKEAAGRYEFALEGADKLAPKLVEEPVLRWSNPSAGEVHGNVFLWTAGGRPAVVGSIFKWFSPHTHMSHEFHSLAEQPLSGKFDGNEVWSVSEPGVRFAALAGAPTPAAGKPQRLLQMRDLAMGCAVTKRERDDTVSELRLLPQPIFRYEAPQAGVIDGAIFVFVQGTDPDLFLLLEARQSGGKAAWQFAACRMNSVGLSLRYKDKEIGRADVMPWADVNGHRQAYTSFLHKQP
jgi:hypothetical protein